MSPEQGRPSKFCIENFEFSHPEIRPIDEQLLEAVYYRSLPRVQELLRNGADVNTRGLVFCEEFEAKLTTPLILASEDGSTDLVKALLECPSVELHGVDNYGRTALHAAAESGHLDVVLELLIVGVDVDFKDKCGFTALHLAALNCRPWVVALLLEAKAMVDSDDEAVEAATTAAMVFLKESIEAALVMESIEAAQGKRSIEAAQGKRSIEAAQEKNQNIEAVIGEHEENAEVLQKTTENPPGTSTKGLTNALEPKSDEMSVENGEMTEVIQNHEPDFTSLLSKNASYMLKGLKRALVALQLEAVYTLLESGLSSDETVEESCKFSNTLSKISKKASENACKSSQNAKQSLESDLKHLVTEDQPLDNIEEASENAKQSLESDSKGLVTEDQSLDNIEEASENAKQSLESDSKDLVTEDQSLDNIEEASENAKQSLEIDSKDLATEDQSLDNNEEETEVQSVQNRVKMNRKRPLDPYEVELEMIKMLVRVGMRSFKDEHRIMKLCRDSINSSRAESLQNSRKMPSTVEEAEKELLIAARRGDSERVKKLLKFEGIDVNVADDLGNTPLHLAATGGHSGTVDRLFVLANVQPNSRNKYGKTPLICAVERCRDAAVKVLTLREEVDVNAKDYFNKCSLTIAATKGYTGIVKSLLRREDLDVNVREGGYTVLHIAVASNYPQMVADLLLRKDIKLHDTTMELEQTPLHLAIRNRNLGIAKALLDHPGVDANKKGVFDDSPLHVAIDENHLEMVELLLQKKPFVNKRGLDLKRSPLHLAAEKGNLDIVQALLKHPSVIVNIEDDEGDKPVDLAVKNGHEDCAEVLRQPRRTVKKKWY